MNTYPKKLTATNCAAASDGGSLFLRCVDPEQRQYGFHLDWSFEAQATGTMQLSVNNVVVPKGSLEEKEWLGLLANADVEYRDPDAPDEDYSDSVRSGLDEILLRARSDAYQQSKGSKE